jgi:hypothetical protein
MQKRSDAEFGIDPRYLYDITRWEYGGISHTKMIDVNRCGEERERQSTNFDLLPGFLLEIGNHLGPVVVDVNQRGYNENKR